MQMHITVALYYTKNESTYSERAELNLRLRSTRSENLCVIRIIKCNCKMQIHDKKFVVHIQIGNLQKFFVTVIK